MVCVGMYVICAKTEWSLHVWIDCSELKQVSDQIILQKNKLTKQRRKREREERKRMKTERKGKKGRLVYIDTIELDQDSTTWKRGVSV